MSEKLNRILEKAIRKKERQYKGIISGWSEARRRIEDGIECLLRLDSGSEEIFERNFAQALGLLEASEEENRVVIPREPRNN